MRKKWTAREASDAADIQSKEKKKWQIALRRYVLDKNPSRYYASFFGVDIETFRNWIEIQFNASLNWENFGKEWQFEHIIPASYFSNDEQDMKLCWNFTNIIVSSVHIQHPTDILSSRLYFQKIWEKTGYVRCRQMLDKIDFIESQNNFNTQLAFLDDQKEPIKLMMHYQEDDFERLNKGETLKDLELEKQILSRFGS